MSNSCFIACYHCQKAVYLDKIGWKFASESSHPQLKGYMPVNVEALSWDDLVWMMEVGNLDLVNQAKNQIEPFLEEHLDHLVYILSDDDVRCGNHDQTVSQKNDPACILLDTHQSWVTTVTFSSNGEYMANGDGKGVIHIWKSKTGEKIQKIQAHQNYISSLFFTSDNQKLISAGGESLVKIWDILTGKLLQSLDGLELQSYENQQYYSILSLITTPDDKYLISNDTYYQNELKIWELDSLKLLKKLKKNNYASPYYIAINPNGKELAGSTQSIAYSYRGDLFAAIVVEGESFRDYSYYLKIWNIESQEIISIFEIVSYQNNYIYDLKFSPDDQYIAVSVNQIKTITKQLEGKPFPEFFWHEENSVKIYQIETGELVKIFPEEKIISCLAFSPDGKFLVTSNYDFNVRQYNLESLKIIPLNITLNQNHNLLLKDCQPQSKKVGLVRGGVVKLKSKSKVLAGDKSIIIKNILRLNRRKYKLMGLLKPIM